MGAGFYQEILAYCQLTGAEIGSWEMQMLRLLYGLHNAANAQEQDKPQKASGRDVIGMLRGMSRKMKDGKNG
jgi:hypothetical protein